MNQGELELQEINQCSVCLNEDKCLDHKCNRCRECMICSNCAAELQERGQADKCPVCQKNTPWCDKFIIVDEKQSNRWSCDAKKLEFVVWRVLIAIMFLLFSWLIGYIYALSNKEEFEATPSYSVALRSVVYIAIGGLWLLMVGMCCLFCALCFGGCISLGISSEQNV